MTAFVIVAAICLAVGIVDSLIKRKRARDYKQSRRGSRAVELEEWDKWSKQLLAEYNELTGRQLSYPEIVLKSDDIIRAYYEAFSGPYELTEANLWKDAKALETLRIRRNLPSDDDLYALDEWMYSKKIMQCPPRYTSLAYLINQCVKRAVVERGYNYGGTDYEGLEAARLKWKEIEEKNGWIKNDPHNRR